MHIHHISKNIQVTRKKCLLSSEATLLGWVCPGCSRLPPGVFGDDGGGGCDAGSCFGCIGCDKYRDCGVKTWWTFAKPVICNSIRSSSNFVRRPCGSKLPNIVIGILVKVAKIPDHCLVIKDQPVDHQNCGEQASTSLTFDTCGIFRPECQTLSCHWGQQTQPSEEEKLSHLNLNDFQAVRHHCWWWVSLHCFPYSIGWSQAWLF